MSRPNRPLTARPRPPLPDPHARPSLPPADWEGDDLVPWCWPCRRAWKPSSLDAGKCPNCGAATVAREADPFDILPGGAEAFREEWDAETVEAARRKAERAPTTTDPETLDRCPGTKETGEPCLSVRLQYRPARPAERKCDTCDTYTSTPVAPLAAFDADAPRCPSCGGPRLVDAPRAANAWKCLDCGETFDDAVEAGVEEEADPEPAPEPEDPDDPTEDDDPDPTMPRDLKTETETYRIPTGDDLRALREALGLSLRDVPLAAGTTIGRWEREEVAPRLDRLEELVEYYRAVDAARRAVRLDAALGELEDDPEAEEEPTEPEADPDPFEWVEEPEPRAATDGGRP
ncbi:helix-turn-helix domain-containing protein [Halorubrum sp. BOL3-1]|uniref:helix-turn-helix domain-containing protein n=1 Tax=Halorubrum sp. BOL3-1 TaxID=2497325 RepID=UPI0014077530|nr:helix-turn-helix domain-containing protein [Halorubrum sp. BOL3-1]